ncbi:MAG: hypothetical protein GX359_10800 [Clostridiales bacterium]|nr:hypothetical protein [Clostridiales bacterium]
MTTAILVYQLVILGLILIGFSHGKMWGFIAVTLALIWTFTQVWLFSPVMFIQLFTILIGSIIGKAATDSREEQKQK